MPASKRSSRWYSWRTRLFSVIVLIDATLADAFAPSFALSLVLVGFLLIVPIVADPAADLCEASLIGHLKDSRHAMPAIVRSALVEHSAARMFALVNDVAAYPRRFDWCNGAEVLEQSHDRLTARLDLGIGGFSTWFTTENSLSPPHHIDMNLRDGPFKR